MERKILLIYRGDNEFANEVAKKLKESGHELEIRGSVPDKIIPGVVIVSDGTCRNEIKILIGREPIDIYDGFYPNNRANIVETLRPLIAEIRAANKVPVAIESTLADHLYCVNLIGNLQNFEKDYFEIFGEHSQMATGGEYGGQRYYMAGWLALTLKKEFGVPVITQGKFREKIEWWGGSRMTGDLHNALHELKLQGEIVLLVDHHMTYENIIPCFQPDLSAIVTICRCCIDRRDEFSGEHSFFKRFPLKHKYGEKFSWEWLKRAIAEW